MYRPNTYTPAIDIEFWTDIDQVRDFVATKITKTFIDVKWRKPVAPVTDYELIVKLIPDKNDKFGNTNPTQNNIKYFIKGRVFSTKLSNNVCSVFPNGSHVFEIFFRKN